LRGARRHAARAVARDAQARDGVVGDLAPSPPSSIARVVRRAPGRSAEIASVSAAATCSGAASPALPFSARSAPRSPRSQRHDGLANRNARRALKTRLLYGIA
jgi:hypothetical protein